MATRPASADDIPHPPEMRPVAMRMAARDWSEFADPGQQGQWDALAEWAAEPNPFFESWYLLPSLRGFDERGRVKLLCLEADGQLAGLMPLRRDLAYYRYPFPQWSTWIHSNCFLGAPLVARGFEAAFWRELLAWADQNSGPALFLHLSHLPLHGPLWDALTQVCRDGVRAASVVKREERAMLASDLSPEDYFEAALGGKKRKELRRQRRRLEEEGRFEVRRRTDSEGLESWIDEFLALERAGWKGAEGSALASAPRTEALFREALSGAAARGKLERLGLRIDGKPVAMLASFLTPPGAYSYKTTFDEAYSRYSPGVLLQRENLAMLERPGIEWTDSCAAADHPMIDHLWTERRAIGRVNVAIGGAKRRALFGAIARRETGRPAGELE
ncbi:GNAT family N-acetyltransferase [Altererythrobacter salegens]|uniref:GNAT family N-acetyltransferase n=1 Tax=Croceibacterium salegens TaxID=1737568 RepID=A0A6I4SWK5_9SPHN|nr:GNAT family N-acetyltransferase [Croceibacterium salegens]MXO60213.1 GNAT family N-acetyltransferase [Croceibacterium salegens]